LGQKQGLFVPSGKHTKNYGKSPFLMGTSAILKIAMLVYQRVMKMVGE